MVEIQQHFSLKNYNTFGIEAFAERFVEVTNEQDLVAVLKDYKDIFVISGGSNMLLTQNIDKTVIHLNTKGIEKEILSDNTCLVTAQSGENWHEFVRWTVEHNLGGLENLSLIPGNVGATPIQNIGAYGVEVKDSIVSLEAIEINSLEKRVFTKEECQFGYRESIFKKEQKGKYIITSVTFKLTTANHTFHTSYGAISNELKGVENVTVRDISDAVIRIRRQKLPDPKEIGNSGSFFKNPVVEKSVFEKVIKEYPNAPHYPISEDAIKIPAGWLIEQCGFKGKRFGNTGTYHQQALVLVNHGNATGKEIFEFAQHIQNTVQQTFGIWLEMEVNVI
ncbi:MAG: UDP-N-acetylmuramate dehydrogenase [Flavobacteriaceae bacterium]|nr:UDP-N-acetylmuramate dehydrogenase [Flavobacteriaceae bacterium]